MNSLFLFIEVSSHGQWRRGQPFGEPSLALGRDVSPWVGQPSLRVDPQPPILRLVVLVLVPYVVIHLMLVLEVQLFGPL